MAKKFTDNGEIAQKIKAEVDKDGDLPAVIKRLASDDNFMREIFGNASDKVQQNALDLEKKVEEKANGMDTKQIEDYLNKKLPTFEDQTVASAHKSDAQVSTDSGTGDTTSSKSTTEEVVE